MSKSLFRNFVLLYIFIGAAAFLFISSCGSYMVEQELEKSVSEDLYEEAHIIASDNTIRHNISSSSLNTVQKNLTAIAGYQDSIIWIINSSNEIVLSTSMKISP